MRASERQRASGHELRPLQVLWPGNAMTAENEWLAIYGEPVTPELARTLDLGGYRWKAVATADEAAEFEPPGGWAGAIIDCGADATGAWAFARTIRKREPGN